MNEFSSINVLGSSVLCKDNISRKNWLRDRNIVVFGDSTASLAGNYMEILANEYNIQMTNNAVPGQALSGSLNDILQYDFSDYDICIICYGTNDWGSGAVIDTTYSEPYKWCESMVKAIKHIQGSACDVVFIFPQYCHNPNLQDGEISDRNTTLDNFIDAGIKVCNMYNVKYINLYNLAGVNKNNWTLWLDGVGYHPQTKLAHRIAQYVYDGLFNTGLCNFDCMWNAYDKLLFSNNITDKNDGAGIAKNKVFGRNLVVLNGITATSNKFTTKADKYIFSGYYVGLGTATIRLKTADGIIDEFTLTNQSGYIAITRKLNNPIPANAWFTITPANGQFYLFKPSIMMNAPVTCYGSVDNWNTTVPNLLTTVHEGATLQKYGAAVNGDTFTLSSAIYFNGNTAANAGSAIVKINGGYFPVEIPFIAYTTDDFGNPNKTQIPMYINTKGEIITKQTINNNQPIYLPNITGVLLA